jgi:hypothetical protein
MTNEQINIAIAEACGWKEEEFGPSWYQSYTKMPNFCNDLNAMHEAEKRMRNGDWTRYCQYLAEYGGGTVRFVSVHATAPNRAEAFLRTIGKWEGAK